MINESSRIFILIIRDFLPVINPIIIAMVYLVLRGNLDKQARRKDAIIMFFTSAIIVLIILAFGVIILKLFGLKISDLRIAGGLIIIFTAWTMLYGKASEALIDKAKKNDLIVFPITVPLTIGGGAIALIFNIASYISADHFTDKLFQYSAAYLGMIVVLSLTAICCYYAQAIKALLKEAGTKICITIFSIILLGLGVNILVTGIKAAFLIT